MYYFAAAGPSCRCNRSSCWRARGSIRVDLHGWVEQSIMLSSLGEIHYIISPTSGKAINYLDSHFSEWESGSPEYGCARRSARRL